jgi:hypothetical protein
MTTIEFSLLMIFDLAELGVPIVVDIDLKLIFHVHLSTIEK